MNSTFNSNEDLMQKTRNLIADAEDLLSATIGQTGEKATEVRQRIAVKLAKAKAELAHMQEVAVEKAKIAGKATDEYVHDNPWKSVGIAGVAGLVIGALISRR